MAKPQPQSNNLDSQIQSLQTGNPVAALGFQQRLGRSQLAQGLTDFSDLTPDQAKASLGLATHLQSHLLPPKGQQASQEPQNAPEQAQQAQPQEDTNGPRIDAIEAKIADLEEKTSGKIKEGLDQIKTMIKEALSEDGQED